MSKYEVVPNPMYPTATLLAKLGSAIVHAEEFLSADGQAVDQTAFQTILEDPTVQEWLEQMAGYALVPLRRNKL